MMGDAEGALAGGEALVVLVRLKEGVSAEDYERFVRESYTPAVRRLPSVSGWNGYRVRGTLGGDAEAPCEYVVVTELADAGRLGEDMRGEEMRALFERLHGLVELTQLAVERFA
jgi:hypothetical protein